MTKLPLDRTPLYRFYWFADSWAGPDRVKALDALQEEGNASFIDNHAVDVWFDLDSNRMFDVLYLRGEPLPLFDSE